jgi:hypothetical protein
MLFQIQVVNKKRQLQGMSSPQLSSAINLTICDE